MHLILLIVLVGAAFIMSKKHLMIFALAAILTVAFRASSVYDEDRMLAFAVLILIDSYIFIYGLIRGIKRIIR